MKTASRHLRFSSVLEKSGNKLWGHHVRVPPRVIAAMVKGSSRRVWCSLNGTPEHQCAVSPIGRGVYVIAVNKSLQKKLHLEPGDPVDVKVRRDESPYGLPLPEEFRELLRQDKVGNRVFHRLTAGKQRTLLYIIGKGKNSDQKIERSIIVTEHLKKNRGKIDYRRLTEELRKGRSKKLF